MWRGPELPIITRCPLGGGWWLIPPWSGNISTHLSPCPLTSQRFRSCAWPLTPWPPKSCPFCVREARVQTSGKQMNGQKFTFSHQILIWIRRIKQDQNMCVIKLPSPFYAQPCSCLHCVSERWRWRPSGHELRSSFHFPSSREVCMTPDCHWPVQNWYFTTKREKQ